MYTAISPAECMVSLISVHWDTACVSPSARQLSFPGMESSVLMQSEIHIFWLYVVSCHWTPTSSHNSTMEATGSACKRTWLECCHLSMPSPQPAACAGQPVCINSYMNVWDLSVWVLIVFEVMQFVTMHPVFNSLSLIVCYHSAVSPLLAIITHTQIYCPLNINQWFDQQI